MKSERKNGEPYESTPEVAEYEDVTESRLVLYAIRDAMNRFNYACRIVIHTESAYVAAVIDQNWVENWKVNGWKNARGEDVKDAVLWDEIYREAEETGHEIASDAGKHEYSNWMNWNMHLATPLVGIFKEYKSNAATCI